MTEIAALTTILGSIKTATEIAKLIKDSDLSFEKAETKLKLADLISALADAKIEAAELQRLIFDKDEKIKELEEALKIKQNLRYEDPYYWLDVDTKKEGPFCQTCYDSDGKLIRLQGAGEGYWICNVCKNEYADKNFKPSESGLLPVGASFNEDY
jgi:ribosomal protein L37AE/L43A